MPPTVFERVQGYLTPAVFIVASAAYFLQTAITAPKLLFTDFKSYRDRAFAKLWLAVGEKFAEEVPPSFNPIFATSHGVILEVGPGAGHHMFRYSNPEKITAIYGVEPGVDMHAALQENAKKAGLGEKYKILSCGAEPESLIPALAKEALLGKEQSLSEGVFDEVVCVRVLCGIPKPTETIANLYACLKPGGRFVVCEHVVSDANKGGSIVGGFLQQFYMAIGWSFWLAGCQLTRDTTASLMKAAEADGGWAKVNLETVDEWSVLPHIVGYCTKKA